MKVLLIDDEKQLVSAVSTILKQHKFSVDFAYDGEDGLDMALSGVYDVIILDVMMPKMNGFIVLKELRNNKISTPVLMLSAKSETGDKVQGLNLGADDYLAKPFDTNELLARVRALLRRKAEFTGDQITYKDLTLDRDTFELCKDEHRIALGKKEFGILEVLMLNAGKTIDKERLIEKIWGYDTNAEYNTIEVYVSFIRRKIQALGSNAEIKAVRGLGYMLGERND